jgi:hypothetical protein
MLVYGFFLRKKMKRNDKNGKETKKRKTANTVH